MPPHQRRCLACRKIGIKSEFWRIVRLHPTGTVQLDQGMGRSAYLCPEVRCLQIAQKKNRLGRSLKTQVPDVIYNHLWQRLTPSNPTPSSSQQSPELTRIDKQELSSTSTAVTDQKL